MADEDLLELIHLYADQDEGTVLQRSRDWANEGITEADVNEWTDVREGTFWYIVRFPGVREDARIYDEMGTVVVAAAHPLYAFGRYLDAHAEVQQLARQAAEQAEGLALFTGPQGTVIAEGLTVTTAGDDPVEFEVIIPAETPVDGDPEDPTSVSTLIRAAVGGVEGNLPVGAITDIITPPTGELTVTNVFRTQGGTDTENDDRLRGRLLERYGAGTGWNARALKVAALSFGQGIGRATVIPRWDGPTTAKVIIATAEGEPVSTDTVDAFQAFIDPILGQGAGAMMVGIEVTVETVAILDVTPSATVEFELGYSLDGAGGTTPTRDVITARVRAYVESQESGGEVVQQLIAREITSVRGLHDVSVPLINGVDANLAIDDDPAQIPALAALTLTEGSL